MAEYVDVAEYRGKDWAGGAVAAEAAVVTAVESESVVAVEPGIEVEASAPPKVSLTAIPASSDT